MCPGYKRNCPGNPAGLRTVMRDTDEPNGEEPLVCLEARHSARGMRAVSAASLRPRLVVENRIQEIFVKCKHFLKWYK